MLSISLIISCLCLRVKKGSVFLNIRESFKNARINRNITQEKLAFKIHMTRQMIVQIEKGVGLPSLNIAIETADAFNCSLDELVGRDTIKEV